MRTEQSVKTFRCSSCQITFTLGTDALESCRSRWHAAAAAAGAGGGGGGLLCCVSRPV